MQTNSSSTSCSITTFEPIYLYHYSPLHMDDSDTVDKKILIYFQYSYVHTTKQF